MQPGSTLTDYCMTLSCNRIDYHLQHARRYADSPLIYISCVRQLVRKDGAAWVQNSILCVTYYARMGLGTSTDQFSFMIGHFIECSNMAEIKMGPLYA
jgi:hypothetical protein